MTIILRRPWTRQPSQLGFPVSDERGIVWVPPSHNAQFVAGTSVNQRSVPQTYGVGAIWEDVANAGIAFGTRQFVPNSTELTVLFTAAASAEARSAVVFSQRYNGGEYAQYAVGINTNRIFTSTSNRIVLISRNTAGTNNVVSADNQFDGLVHTWVLANSVDAGYIIRDGVPQTLVDNDRLSGTIAVAGMGTRIGNYALSTATGAQMKWPLGLVVVWPYVVPIARAIQLSQNPWQLFAPRRIIIPVGAAAPTTFIPSWARQNSRVIGGGV